MDTHSLPDVRETPTRQDPPASTGSSLRSALPGLVIDGLLPFLTYMLLTSYVPSLSEVVALGLSAVFPTVNGLISIIRRRRLDIIGAIVLLGIVVSIVATVAGGSPKLMLIRESGVAVALGVVCLTSFLWPRPLMFYIGRQVNAGDNPAKLAEFNTLWQSARARHTFRVMTAVWSIGWLGEFALRILMVWKLSIPQVLAISPFVFNGITIGLVAWTFAYTNRKRKEGEQGKATTTSA
jgi:hypothetical protein